MVFGISRRLGCRGKGKDVETSIAVLAKVAAVWEEGNCSAGSPLKLRGGVRVTGGLSAYLVLE